MEKIINYNGKTLKIVAEKYVYPVCHYDYKVYELRKKKHWWNFSKVEIISGSTLWWTEDEDFEIKIMEKIEFHYAPKHINNVEKFFSENP